MRIRSLLLGMMLLVGAYGPAEVSPEGYPVSAINPIEPSKFPGHRGENQMVVFSNTAGLARTGTNPWGMEVEVRNGIVTAIGGNNREIPEDGFIVSGHGKAADWMAKYLEIGAPVAFTESELRIDRRTRAKAASLAYRVDLLEQRLTDLHGGKPVDLSELRTGLADMRNRDWYDGIGIAEDSVAKLEQQEWREYLQAMDSPATEVRAVWNRLSATTEEGIAAELDKMAAAGVNVLFVESVYGSQSIFIDDTGLYRHFPKLGGLDALEVLLREGHKRGIQIHVWAHCFFIGAKDDAVEPALIADAYPDWIAKTRAGDTVSKDEARFMYVNPAHPEARKAMIAAYRSLAKRYAIDGFQFDYIRYGHYSDLPGMWDYSDYTRATVKKELGFDPLEITPEANADQWKQWLGWRENTITSFVREASAALREERPGIVLSADIFPNVDAAIRIKGQNWAAWGRDGLVDVLIPMAYYKDVEPVAKATVEMRQLLPTMTCQPIGLGTYLGLRPREAMEQIKAVRANGGNGAVLYSWEQLSPETAAALKAGPWRNPAKPCWVKPGS